MEAGVVDTEAVRSAVGRVQDPEIHQSLDALKMIRSVDVTTDGDVRVTVALTGSGYAMEAELMAAVTGAAASVEGVGKVTVDFEIMSDDERTEFVAHVRGGSASGAPSVREIPFAKAGNRTRIISISSGTGGVGKSSVTANLAVALTKLAKRV
ncbi:MAG: DUF59 domain-containing protein, partial [Acidobacteria bacterium]|nr:DUF59 domain-containing protein [Acidobacteriota bacterium]